MFIFGLPCQAIHTSSSRYVAVYNEWVAEFRGQRTNYTVFKLIILILISDE